jgi:hypothetical protein
MDPSGLADRFWKTTADKAVAVSAAAERGGAKKPEPLAETMYSPACAFNVLTQVRASSVVSLSQIASVACPPARVLENEPRMPWHGCVRAACSLRALTVRDGKSTLPVSESAIFLSVRVAPLFALVPAKVQGHATHPPTHPSGRALCRYARPSRWALRDVVVECLAAKAVRTAFEHSSLLQRLFYAWCAKRPNA